LTPVSCLIPPLLGVMVDASKVNAFASTHFFTMAIAEESWALALKATQSIAKKVIILFRMI
jgi:hypothetical protein